MDGNSTICVTQDFVQLIQACFLVDVMGDWTSCLVTFLAAAQFFRSGFSGIAEGANHKDKPILICYYDLQLCRGVNNVWLP